MQRVRGSGFAACWGIIGFGLLVAGCGGIKVRQDYDPAVDFNALRSFNWLNAKQAPTGDDRADSGLLDARIRSAVEAELLGRGYRKVTGTPDFRVAYKYSIENGAGRDPYDTGVGVGVGVGAGSRGSFGGVGFSFGLGSERERAVLTLDIIDSPGENLLWRGVARRDLVWRDDPAENIARINETVAAILDKFPPRENTRNKNK